MRCDHTCVSSLQRVVLYRDTVISCL
jgi:hypothetical protein